MSDEHEVIDHEAIRTGAIPWSGDELDQILQQARGAMDTVEMAAARAREQKLDITTAMAHGTRMFAVIDFLHAHKQRLFEIGLLLPRDNDFDLISSHLLDVLATFPFTAPTGAPGPNGRPSLGFDPDDVIIEAGRRQKADDEDADPGPAAG